MSRIPKELIGHLNSGQCIAIVGSGPSCELGYPSWKTLAEEAVSLVKKNVGSNFDDPLYSRLMKAEDYPKVFKYAEQHVNRKDILQQIQQRIDNHASTINSSKRKGKAYSFLSQWPIKFYLTTNWDSEISRHLGYEVQHFTTISNSKSEITQLSIQTTRQIVFLHGQLYESPSVVLTDDDYHRFKVDDTCRYFRDTLVSLFRTFPVLILGHSMRDPDLQTILEAAKCIAPSSRTIFMIVGDAKKEQIDEYLSKYNIHILSYNSKGNHHELLRILSLLDLFVIPRNATGSVPIDLLPEEEIDLATSLLFFNSLYQTTHNSSLMDRFISPQILRKLHQSENACNIDIIRESLIPDGVHSISEVSLRIPEELIKLEEIGLIESSNNRWSISKEGIEHVEEISVKQSIEDDQVFGPLTTRLEEAGIGDENLSLVKDSLRSAIVSVFRKRGIAASSLVFRGKSFEPIDMEELFEAITRSVQWLENFKAREAFITFTMELFTNPTSHQRKFLARLSQGLFAVHLFGAGAFAFQPRINIFKKICWFIDSNVLIYLFAKGASFSNLSQDICKKGKQLGIRFETTPMFIEEALKGLNWASSMCDGLSAEEEMEFLFNQFHASTYRQNPYIEGFVSLSKEKGFRRFSEYKKWLGIENTDKAKGRLREYGISVNSVITDEASGSLDPMKSDLLNQFTTQIENERNSRGTSRGGNIQALAEAEILFLLLEERGKNTTESGELKSSYFVSMSQLLDDMYSEQYGTLTWSPETLFRHLSLFCPSEVDDESLMKGLATEFSQLGITLIDENSFRSYFDPLISTSRLSFQREKQTFIDSLQEEALLNSDELRKEFDATADFSKPLFVSQMLWREQLSEKSQLRQELQQLNEKRKTLHGKLKEEEEAWELRQKRTVEHYENRIRNLTDPKRRQKTENKAKNKRKRKKKRKK